MLDIKHDVWYNIYVIEHRRDYMIVVSVVLWFIVGAILYAALQMDRYM
jgi:hypothetical protein